MTLNEALITRICRTIARGNYVETALALAGVPKSTFFSWMKAGTQQPEENPLQAKLLEAVERAQAEAEARDVKRLDLAAEDDWRAVAWRLERRFPRKWGHLERMELTGMGGGPVETTQTARLDLTKLSNEELELMEKLLTKAKPTDTTETPPEDANGT